MGIRHLPRVSGSSLSGACRLLITSPASSESERQLVSIAIASPSLSTVLARSERQKPLLLIEWVRFQSAAAHRPQLKHDFDDQHEVIESQTRVHRAESIRGGEKSSNRDPLDLTFNDTKTAFKSQKTSDLVRAYLVLKLGSYDLIIRNYQPLIKYSRMILGQKLFHALMKSTFYGQFVAGENGEKAQPAIDHLRSFGVKSIFNYSVEADLSESGDFEAVAEKNLEIFLNCMDNVAKRAGPTGFAAIKLTALVRPKILFQLSEGWYKNRTNNFEEMVSQANLTPQELERFNDSMRKIRTLAKFTKDANVRFFVDAEQTYLQPAINLIVIQMMREFNTEKAVIFNTYQCYLKSTYDNVCRDIALAEKENFYFGAKFVRGAYLDEERERAQKMGYEDPINPSYEATTRMYEKTLEHLMTAMSRLGPEKNRYTIMCASHNEDTVRFALKKMEALGIRREDRMICFGQIYGMCNHISFQLGQSGYSIYKNVPYGEVEQVLPYMCRRAIENKSVLHRSTRERKLLLKEIQRRLISGQIFHKPIGNYEPA